MGEIRISSSNVSSLEAVSQELYHLLIKQGLKTSGIIHLPNMKSKVHINIIKCDLTKADMRILLVSRHNVKVKIRG